MDAYECIVTRRSIRNYNNQPVSEDIIMKLIEAGIQSPTGGKNQQWYFAVIQNEDQIDVLREVVKKYYPSPKSIRGGTFFNAKCLILVFFIYKKSWYHDLSDINHPIDNPDYATAFAATENILLAAHALGLGSCWCRPQKLVRDYMTKEYGPDDSILCSAMTVGYYDELKQKSRFKRNNMEECYAIHV